MTTTLRQKCLQKIDDECDVLDFEEDSGKYKGIKSGYFDCLFTKAQQIISDLPPGEQADALKDYNDHAKLVEMWLSSSGRDNGNKRCAQVPDAKEKLHCKYNHYFQDPEGKGVDPAADVCLLFDETGAKRGSSRRRGSTKKSCKRKSVCRSKKTGRYIKCRNSSRRG